jgi:hypothetical protein
MKKKDSIISDLTDFFDHHLLSTGKKELALKTANQLIKGEEKFQGVDLKLLLEEGEILQAYQTEISPRQWYIKFSQPNKYRELRKEYLSQNKSQPLTVKVTEGNSLRNDLEAIGNGFEKLKENRNLKMVGWVIVILMAVVFFYKVSTDKNNNETKYYTKSGFYYAVSKEAFDKMYDYSIAKDNSALNTLIQDGEIVTLPEGVEVNVENYYLAYAVIRPQGETYKLWCASEAISQK